MLRLSDDYALWTSIKILIGEVGAIALTEVKFEPITYNRTSPSVFELLNKFVVYSM